MQAIQQQENFRMNSPSENRESEGWKDVVSLSDSDESEIEDDIVSAENGDRSEVTSIEGEKEEKDSNSSLMEVDEEEIYEVERILDRRMARHDVEYYVKWKGYPANQGTWETYWSLEEEGASGAVEEYERRKELEMERESSKW